MKKSPARNVSGLLTASAALVLMGIAIFATAGCAGPYPSDPMDVFKNFTLDIANQDFDSAKTYCTQNYIDNEFNEALSEMKTMADMSEMGEISKFQSSMEGDTVKVWVKDQEFFKIVLIKENGKWKIDKTEAEFSEQDAINMMKGLGSIGDAFGK